MMICINNIPCTSNIITTGYEYYRDQVFTIGIVNRVPTPLVVNDFLRNVPERGFYGISPGAYFGIYKPDTFWFTEERR